MHDSKLLDVLRLLTPKQLKRWEELAHSPYFNKSRHLSDFCSYLVSVAPLFSESALNRQKVFREVFPKQSFDEKKLSYLMSDALSLVEQLLIFQKWEENPVAWQNQVTQIYNELGIDKHYRKSVADTEALLSRHPFEDADFYYQSFLLEAVRNVHFDKQRLHTFDSSLQNAIDKLDIYYLILKLKYGCEIFNRQNVVAANYEIRLLDEISLYLSKNDIQVPAVLIYYNILLSLRNADEEQYFIELKRLLAMHAHRFPPLEARDMYAYAQNYCIKKINTGDNKYLKELFDLYRNCLEKQLVYSGRFMSPWTYKNIASVAMRNNDYQWAAQFIEAYKDRLEPEFRNNAYAFNLASLYFNQKEFDKAQNMLISVEFTDVFYQLDSKAMLLRIYFETGEVEALSSLLEAFRVLLRRNKLVSDYQRTIYLNLIKYTREIMKINKGDKQAKSLLAKEVNETKEIAYRSWLLEKLKV